MKTKGFLRLLLVIATAAVYNEVRLIIYRLAHFKLEDNFFYWWSWAIALPVTGAIFMALCAIFSVIGWVVSGFKE